MKTEAMNYFLGKEGFERKNCAQAVLMVFKDALGVPESMIVEHGAFGSGKAPENECGAIYAAKELLLKADDEAGATLLGAFFDSEAGSTKCREIRHAKRMSCVACVQNAVGFIEERLEQLKGMEVLSESKRGLA